jgi:glycosyltransferase involved in cell wall biosynthesis
MANAPAMSDAICQLLANPAAARHMGEAGRQRVLQNFTIEQTVAKVEHIYDEILETAQVKPAHLIQAHPTNA